ncbi:MAG: isocitrate lyase/PEP mutase family protein [Rhodospirillaceae bacterium]|jgi:2-methylisocitrate lyase-like PEP mutase family enzyme|nr:isocitrate lyase/PEP mutase family protein [Rhodospirillaceae bacterium]MBT5455636.1 isocitrate lyase/PEP mutase family protein [Rhodospirillaceae bacterium]
MESKGAKLRALIEAPEILICPGIYDGYSARMAAKYGYRTAVISGAGVSECHLGWADKGIMGYEENVRVCRALAECSDDLLLQADADTGYGNAVNVHFVVRGFEAAGMAAVMIEDQVWPKRCGHLVGKSVIPAGEMVDKVKAAVDARRDDQFVIKARTDAAGPIGLTEAIDRLNLYAEAGADVLFADALMSEEDIAAVAGSVPKPLSVNMGLGLLTRGTTPLIHPKRLQEMGVAMISYPRLMSTGAVRGMMNAMDALTDMIAGDEPVERPDLLVPFKDLNALVGIGFLDELEDRYAGTE